MLDINDKQDVAKIIEAIPTFRNDDVALIKKYLPNDPMWHEVGDFESVILVSGKNKIGMRLTELVEIANILHELDLSYKNVKFLTKKLNNVPQVKSTFFEIRVAYACHKDKTNKKITFFDDAGSSGKSKTAEFCWHTNVCDIDIECKTINILQASNKINKKLSDIHATQNIEYNKFSWPKDVKLSVGITFPLKGSYRERLAEVIRGAYQNIGKTSQVEEFTALASSEFSILEEGSIALYSASVKQAGTPERLSEATRTRTYASYLSNLAIMVKNTLKEARKQISIKHKGIIFVQVSHFTTSLNNLIQQTLTRKEFVHIIAVVVVDLYGKHHRVENIWAYKS